MRRYTKLAYKDPDEILFGHAKFPVQEHFGIVFGAGFVVPEVKVAPAPGTEKDKESLVREMASIAEQAASRAVDIGLPAFMLEQEHVFQQTYYPDWAYDCTHAQLEVLEKYYKEYGVRIALRQTVADIRVEEKGGLRGSEYDNRIAETIERCCEAGASDIAAETMGGKSVIDYGVMRGDIKALLFGEYLAHIDMEYFWTRAVNICRKYDTRPAGDTHCSGANTAMFVAGGLMGKDMSHTGAALVRAMSAARSLVAVECGATGPLKDCGYENTIIKFITGVPIAQEGKDAVCAHSDIMGNLVCQAVDVWSNESVFHREEMGGPTPAVWLQATGYEAALMNTAIQAGYAKVLRDLYALTDMYRDPQALILAYPNAFRIAKAIVEYGKDPYLRSRAAALEAAKIIKEAYEAKRIALTRFELDSLNKFVSILESLPMEADKFVDECLREYKGKIPTFDPKSYEL
ncbi:MAG: methanol--corrinoid methyltransferase [Thermoproteota archaeon]|uniref:Methanol--corrinoid methyltransferase n=1 Tax=Candidatus Methanodesulfokora washburnensis TaxID=2478471 RepID=A0A3R9R1T6_9CREN|nr:methyltransferase MtaB domain-containing protein [Candidatus Methanodesulfokores washburnensis]RSN72859.1 methanol--corrinoid methyltransferase [Candidatus Methanodesulfokores washburnensis]RZN63761.1 MAG: methanol--corrinoid methyltransferase [Candidatus Methanodesulfokores washburnensis]TDA40896.1 MAG: methanol--corrinoid methyltransferase [Candidatus Korarchaeota archaeon]